MDKVYKNLSCEIQNQESKVKLLLDEQNSLNGRIIILQQMNAKEEVSHKDQLRRLTSKVDDLEYSLNRKEFMLQTIEKKNKEFEKILLKRAPEDKYISRRLKLMGIEGDSNLGISNVVEENEMLKTKVKQLELEANSPERRPMTEIPQDFTRCGETPTYLDSFRLGSEILEIEEDTKVENGKLVEMNRKLTLLNKNLIDSLSFINQQLEHKPELEKRFESSQGTNLIKDFEQVLGNVDNSLSSMNMNSIGEDEIEVSFRGWTPEIESKNIQRKPARKTSHI